MKLVAAHGLPNWGGPAAPPAGENCVLLEGQVPRAPQAGNCHEGDSSAAPSKLPAPQQGDAATPMGGRP
jgi:hypothetical protein